MFESIVSILGYVWLVVWFGIVVHTGIALLRAVAGNQGDGE